MLKLALIVYENILPAPDRGISREVSKYRKQWSFDAAWRRAIFVDLRTLIPPISCEIHLKR